MNIIVLVKQVPDPEAIVEVKGDGKGLEVEQKFTMNFFDEFAVEEAIRIREKNGGKVKVISLGGAKTTEVLRKAIAMGVDETLLLEDPNFEGSDGYSTAFVLSKAIEKSDYDLILAGKQALDDDAGEVGPMVAQFLGIPHVGEITRLEVKTDDNMVVVDKVIEGGKEVVKVSLPALLTTQKGLNEPRVPPITGVMKAMKSQIPKMDAKALGLSEEQVGEKGAKIKIERYLPPPKRREVKMIEGEPQEAAKEAVRILMEVERIL